MTPPPAGPLTAAPATRSAGLADAKTSTGRRTSAVPPPGSPPTTGWRARLFAATGGLLNPGVGAAERARLDLVRRARAPLCGPYRIAVISMKGGVGKTTVAACLGLMLAALRDDGVVALDADPNAGTLADRTTGGTGGGLRDLLADLDQAAGVRTPAAHAGLSGRLRVLSGDQGPARGAALRAEDCERVQAVLGRFFDIVVTDFGTGLAHPAVHATLRTADRVVVVGAPTVDGASRADKTLDWLVARGHHALAERAVLVLCAHRTVPGVDRSAIREHFARRCREIVEVPPDPHLRSGGRIELDHLDPAAAAAFLRLCAVVADGFARDSASHRWLRDLSAGSAGKPPAVSSERFERVK